MKWIFLLLLIPCVAISAPKLKTTIIRGLDTDVAGGASPETETVSIPTGKKASIQSFGCAIEGNSIVVLQWGSDATTWKTIRGCAGGMEMRVRRDFKGNGSKKFKIIRYNVTGASKKIIAWLHVLIHDQ